MALLSGSAHSIYGSFSQVGESISLDVRLVEAFGLKPAKSFFVVKEGLINLLPAVEELVGKDHPGSAAGGNHCRNPGAGQPNPGLGRVLLRIRSQQGRNIRSAGGQRGCPQAL
jgi:outer membrane protein insertion porin family